MKKGLLTLLAVFAGITVYGQGSVDFGNNFPNPANGIKVASSGALVPVSGMFHVELFAGPSTATTEAQLTTGLLDAPTSTTPVRILADIQADGFFFGPTAYVQGIAGGGTAVFQVRAWSGSSASYAAALTAPGALVGKSTLFTVAGLGNPLASPSTLPAALNMPGFTVAPVPEPSVIVLGILGVGALLLRRRK